MSLGNLTSISSTNRMQALQESSKQNLGDIALLKEDNTFYVIDIKDGNYTEPQKEKLQVDIAKQFGTANANISILDINDELAAETQTKKGLIPDNTIKNIQDGPDMVMINENKLKDWGVDITPKADITFNNKTDITNNTELKGGNTTNNTTTVQDGNTETEDKIENSTTTTTDNKNQNESSVNLKFGIEFKLSYSDKTDTKAVNKNIVVMNLHQYNAHMNAGLNAYEQYQKLVEKGDLDNAQKFFLLARGSFELAAKNLAVLAGAKVEANIPVIK